MTSLHAANATLLKDALLSMGCPEIVRQLENVIAGVAQPSPHVAEQPLNTK